MWTSLRRQGTGGFEEREWHGLMGFIRALWLPKEKWLRGAGKCPGEVERLLKREMVVAVQAVRCKIYVLGRKMSKACLLLDWLCRAEGMRGLKMPPRLLAWELYIQMCRLRNESSGEKQVGGWRWNRDTYSYRKCKTDNRIVKSGVWKRCVTYFNVGIIH